MAQESADGPASAPSPSIASMFRFFIPLAATSFLILTSHTLMNAGIARLSRPELYLAAFALSKSLYQVIQAPTMIVRQCISGLIRNSQSYLMSKKVFTYVVLTVTGVFLIVSYTKTGLFFFERIMGNPPELSNAALQMIRVMMWLQFAWLLRDGYGPAAIRLRETYILPIGTMVRVGFTSLCVVILSRHSFSHDVFIPGIIFALTGYVEGITVWALVKFRIRDFLRKLDRLPGADEVVRDLTARQVITFSLPILIMSLLRSLGATVINTGLAHTIAPELTIAAYSVAWSVVLCILNTTNMFHQVVLNFMDDQYTKRRRIMRFSVLLVIIQTVLLGLLAFTPIGFFVLRNMVGAGEELSRMGMGVMTIALPLPFVAIIREYYWGIAMMERKTKWLSIGKVVQLGVLCLSVLVLVFLSARFTNPAMIAPLALGISMAAEAVVLAALHYRLKGRL